MNIIMIGEFELHLPNTEKMDKALVEGQFQEIYKKLLDKSEELEEGK